MISARSVSAPKRVSVAVAQPRKTSRLELAFRVTIVSALVIGAGLAWWSLEERLVPLQQHSRTLAVTASRLSDRIDALQRKWSKQDVQQIREQYKELHTQLFANREELKSWMDGLQQASGLQALNIKVAFVKSQPQTLSEIKLAVLTANVAVEVLPLPVETESPYERLLRYLQQLSAEGKRADLAELSMAGGTNSIARALLVFNLWAGDENLEPPTTAIK